ncbi:MAG TPA: hypothetical protein VLZ74_11035 [Methylocella sp.]|nr:hypothetical protein [Methylocella sp.]
MTSKPSKQLGALLNRVPPATANSQPYGSTAVPYAPEQRDGPQVPPPPPPEPEVPLQVLVPRHVRVQLDRMHAETRKPLRALTLEALRGIGITVTDEDIAGKRGRKRS